MFIVQATGGGAKGATTFSITTLSIQTFSIIGLLVTLSINDIQHNVYSVNYAVLLC